MMNIVFEKITRMTNTLNDLHQRRIHVARSNPSPYTRRWPVPYILCLAARSRFALSWIGRMRQDGSGAAGAKPEGSRPLRQ
jgi:hypothetical protein